MTRLVKFPSPAGQAARTRIRPASARCPLATPAADPHDTARHTA